MGAAPPPGLVGIVAIYDRGKAWTVNVRRSPARSRKSVAQVDGRGAKKLKSALADAKPAWRLSEMSQHPGRSSPVAFGEPRRACRLTASSAAFSPSPSR